MTVAAWINVAELGHGQTWIFGENFGTQLNVSDDNKPQLQFANGGGSFSTLRDPLPFVAGAWVHVIGTIGPVPGHAEQTRIRLYRQGQLVADEDFDAVPAPTDCEASMGNNVGCESLGSGQLYQGMLDEVLFYDRALGDADVAALYGVASGGLAADGTACEGGCCTNGACGACQ